MKLGIVANSTEVEANLRTLEPTYIFTRDRSYRCIPAKDFERLIFDCWFIHDLPKYKSEIWDCDDFAICFMSAIKRRWAKVSRSSESLAFGYIESDVLVIGWHAYIWQIDETGSINFYEPQSGKRVNYRTDEVRLIET